MWSQPQGPSVELPMGPQNAVLERAGRVWSQTLGHSVEPPYGAMKGHVGWHGTHVVTPTGAFGGAALRAHKTLYWVRRAEAGM
eukprot:8269218-Pyramimonas_sp.AAC.1